MAIDDFEQFKLNIYVDIYNKAVAIQNFIEDLCEIDKMDAYNTLDCCSEIDRLDAVVDFAVSHEFLTPGQIEVLNRLIDEAYERIYEVGEQSVFISIQ